MANITLYHPTGQTMQISPEGMEWSADCAGSGNVGIETMHIIASL